MENRDVLMGIYSIKNLINNKIYVGQSINIEFRIHQHYLLYDADTKNSYLYNAIKKYGTENFEVEVLETTEDRTKLNELEYKWITHFDACNREKGYNIRLDNGTTYIVSDETKQRISKALTGLSKSEEHKANMPTKYKEGHVLDKEILNKRNESIKLAWKEGRHKGNTIANSGSFQKGHIPSNFGKTCSDETKELMRQRKLGVKQSPEAIAARIESIGYNRIHQFNLDLILIKTYDKIWDIVTESNNKYLQPGIHGCCNGNKEFYKDSVFKYEKDVELINSDNGITFKYISGDIPTKTTKTTRNKSRRNIESTFNPTFVSRFNDDGTKNENFGKDIV